MTTSALRHRLLPATDDTPSVLLLATGEPVPSEVDETAVDEWKRLYDSFYGRMRQSEIGADLTGWNSSFDGAALPAEHLHEWRDAVVDRVTSTGPRRILEVGAGNGIVLAALARTCDEYWATDLSAAAVELLRRSVRDDPLLSDRVRLSTQAAHDITGLPTGHFDAIVLNSVVQYFPRATYLSEVLTALTGLLAPGGILYLGDLRGLRHHPAFVVDVATYRLGHPLSRPAAEALVTHHLIAAKELLVDPGFFEQWAAADGRITGVDARRLRSRYRNEMTDYHYDVVLHHAAADLLDVRDVDVAPWRPGIDPDEIADGRPFRLAGLPSGETAAAPGWHTAVTWAGDPGDDRLEVVYVPESAGRRLTGTHRWIPGTPTTNDPSAWRNLSARADQLIARVERDTGSTPALLLVGGPGGLDLDPAVARETVAALGTSVASRSPLEEAVRGVLGRALGRPVSPGEDLATPTARQVTEIVSGLHEVLGVTIGADEVSASRSARALARTIRKAAAG